MILTLRDALGLSVFLVTHDLDTLYTITDRVAVLAQKKCWWRMPSTRFRKPTMRGFTNISTALAAARR